MLARNYLSLFFLISFFHHSWHSNTVLTKVRDRNGEKSVNAVGDFMTTKSHRNLEELKLDVMRNIKLTKAEKYQRLHLLPSGYSIVTDDQYEFFTPKIQLLPTADGRKQFAISFVGQASMIYRFSSMADKRINSIKELGHKLDEVYREDHKLQTEIFNDPRKILKSHEYLVTDGKDVYSINVGRNRDNSWGHILRTRYGLGMDGGESSPKPPKIKKEKGNLFVQGWLTEEMEKELKPTFGGESERRGIFGRRKSKRVEIEMKDAKQKLIEAFKKQSERYGWPNPVSASFTEYNVRKGPGTPKRIEHLDEAEISRVNILPERSEQEVFDLFYKKGWIDDDKEWQNPELKRLAQNAKQRFGVIPFVDEEVPSTSASSASLSSGSGKIRTEIDQPGPSSTMHSASGGKSMSGRGKHQSVPSTPSNGHEHEQSMEMKRRKHEKRKGLFGRRKGIFGRNGGFARRFG